MKTLEDHLQDLDSLSILTEKFSLSDERLAEIITAAEIADTPHKSVWARLTNVLKDHTDLTTREVLSLVKKTRIINDLGRHPDDMKDFVGLFLSARGFEMSYRGEFNRGRDANFIANEMEIWGNDTKLFNPTQLRPVWENWQVEERDRLKNKLSSHLAFDGSPSDELDRMITTVVGGYATSIETIAARAAAKVALENFIHRVKNHLRGSWMNSTHLMVIFVGEQGNGKSTAVEHFLSPVADFWSHIGFDALDDNSKTYEFSSQPVMFFDEMEAAAKADVEQLKGLMTGTLKQMRQVYQRATTRRIVSTFIGASNRDISTLIKDETGNRRFLQLLTPKITRKEAQSFDALAIWRSVDENAEPPLYSSPDNLQAVQAVQAGQRHLGPVEAWLQDCDGTQGWIKATDAFTGFYLPWAEAHDPARSKSYSAMAFGKELSRLMSSSEYASRIERRMSNGTNQYRILPATASSSPKVLELLK